MKLEVDVAGALRARVGREGSESMNVKRFADTVIASPLGGSENKRGHGEEKEEMHAFNWLRIKLCKGRR